MNIELPPFLKENDEVIIITPASKIDKVLLKGAITRLSSWHLQPVLGKHADGFMGLYSGTIEERLDDLQQALDSKEAKAILCSRGGYGTIHLIDKLDFTLFHKYPKWIIGYSDITVLHNVIQSEGFASLHAPMASQLTVEPESDLCCNYLKDILFGKIPEYHIEKHSFNHPGKARGILRGGNMSVFYGLRGTPYDIPAEGTILFIEDVSERPHVIERMMYNLKLGGILDKISGLIIGQFSDYNEDFSLGKDLYGALSDILKGYNYPICFNFPVGHITDNRPLIEGAEIELNVDKKGSDLRFIL